METGLELLQKEQPTLTQLVLVNMPAGTTAEEATRMAVKEIANFEMILQERPDLKNCNPKSVFLAVRQCISDGLTLSPSEGLVYLIPGKVKVGIENNVDKYDWGAKYLPTANGMLSIAYQSGSILDHEMPKCEHHEDGKVKSVTFKFLVPSYPNPRWETVTYDEVYFEKWRNASSAKNGGNPNANYLSWKGGIDPSFAATKAIRHGLGKRGTNKSAKRIPVPNFEKMPIAAIKAEEAEIINHTDLPM